MEKQWIYKPLPTTQDIEKLKESLNLTEHLAVLLLQRGIDSLDKAKAFFRPQLAQLPNPFLLKDMDKAVSRLQQAIRKQEKILIFGDYDVDGITGIALLIGFLREYYTQLTYYLPDRLTEGYGVSFKSVDWAKRQDISLVIALDCGTSEQEAIEYANGLGIDYIICDHHLPDAELPAAYAFLNPLQPDDDYPFKKISATTIAFKLLQAFCQEERIALQKLFLHLDLVALSIAADMLPLTEENRILAYYGLKVLRQRPRIGLQALLQEIRRPVEVLTMRDLAFGVTPRLNATGRMSHSRKAVELLLAEDYASAKQWTQSIEQDNRRRQELDYNTTQEAFKLLNANGHKNAPTTILYQPHWHLGVLGIVAGHCIDTYPRPTILFTQQNGKLAGSARSVDNFNIYQALQDCEPLLEEYGGHAHAAGLSLRPENLEKFEKLFNDIVLKQALTPVATQIDSLLIDLKIPLEKINTAFFNFIEQFSPFGVENMRPLFASEKIIIKEWELWREKHVRLWVQASPQSPPIEAIGWGMRSLTTQLEKYNLCNLAYYVEQNPTNNPPTLQLRIKNIQWLESQ